MRQFLHCLIAAFFLAAPGLASAKETITFGYLQDPSHEAVLWALKNGKVSSDLIEVDATPLDIAALIQATAARTYDVVQTAAMAIPRAREKGLDLRILGTALRYHEGGEGAGIWVRADSDLDSVDDLKGKRLAVYSIGSAGITLVRIALADVYGLDVSLEGGDLSFVEMPAPAMPAALAGERVDAATLIHAQAYQAMQGGDFKPIAQIAQDLTEKYGVRMVSAVLAGYGEKLEANPEAYREFIRVLRESMEYARANPEEVFPAVAKETGVDPEFFQAWFDRFSDFPAALAEQDLKAIEILWTRAKDLGLLENAPPVQETVWQDAPREEELAR